MTHLELVPVSPVAQLAGVSQHYGKTVALNNITLDIPARCMVGLIGPDGVGKSSLLSLISGARVIEQGNVMVLGGDMRDPKHRRDVCPRIAWMPQGLGKNLYHTLSVYENVDFFARLFGHDKAEREVRINELLTSTGLAPFRDRSLRAVTYCCSCSQEVEQSSTMIDPHVRRCVTASAPAAACGISRPVSLHHRYRKSVHGDHSYCKYAHSCSRQYRAPELRLSRTSQCLFSHRSTRCPAGW